MDIAVGIGDHLTVGFGGFYNRLANLVIDFPNGNPNVTDLPYVFTGTQTFYGVYGNLFYKNIGVQAGIVPIRKTSTVVVESLGTGSDSRGQTDADLFVIGRFGRARWSGTVGAGLYRYGSRAESELFLAPKSTSGNAFSAFANTSVGLGRGVSLDASVWYTGAHNPTTGLAKDGNDSQTRFTIGLGLGR